MCMNGLMPWLHVFWKACAGDQHLGMRRFYQACGAHDAMPHDMLPDAYADMMTLAALVD